MPVVKAIYILTWRAYDLQKTSASETP